MTTTMTKAEGARTHSSDEAARVAQALRREIISGRRRAGSVLSERQIGDAHGVGRAAVRPAVQNLIDEGLATPGGPRSAARVAECGYQDVTDLFVVAQQVSAYGCHLAAQRRSQDDLDHLAALLRRIDSALAKDRPKDVMRGCIEFRDESMRMSDNEALMDMDDVVRPRLEAYFEEIDRPFPSAVGFHAVYGAFVERDADAAYAIVFRLYQDAIDALTAHDAEGRSSADAIAVLSGALED